MHTTCVNSKDNAKSNDSDHIFVIRENTQMFFVVRTILNKKEETLHVHPVQVFSELNRSFASFILCLTTEKYSEL